MMLIRATCNQRLTCVLCATQMIEDEALYELNPKTNRYAFAHAMCWQDAYEELSEDEQDDYQERKAAG